MPGPVRRFYRSRGFALVLGGLGRALITSGTLILLFVAYQLWGTNLRTDQAQDRLDDEFAAQLDAAAEAAETTTTSSTTLPGDGTVPPTPPPTTPASTAPAVAPPVEGNVVGSISIPKIGVREFFFVQGVSVSQLKRGAGHYPETPLPGQAGNAAIAGHRTTYGAPFHNIDDVVPGDEVMVTTLQGTFRYLVSETSIVKPSEVSVLEDKGDNRLTLTACHPKFSARERIIVSAQLVGNPVPRLPAQGAVSAPTDRRAVFEDIDGETASRWPVVLWGLACAAIWLACWLVATLVRQRVDRRSRARHVQWLPYLVGIVPFGICLFLFFENFSLLLPASY